MFNSAPPSEAFRRSAFRRIERKAAQENGRSGSHGLQEYQLFSDGTVEFLWTKQPVRLHGDEHALQVEHAVTEMVTLTYVRSQIALRGRAAALEGRRL